MHRSASSSSLTEGPRPSDSPTAAPARVEATHRRSVAARQRICEIASSVRTRARLGTALSAIAVLFLVFDSAGKLLEVAPVVAGTAQLGYPEDVIRSLGVLLLACVVVYLVPRFAIVGAVLLTGYLGGAVATHVRIGSPLLTHVLFPVYVATLIWGGLLLRNPRLRRALDPREQS